MRIQLDRRYEQVGVARLEAVEGGRTSVTVELQEPLADGEAGIHAGSCFAPGDRLLPLAPVVGGRSRTELDVPREHLVSRDFSLVVSARDTDVSVACGKFATRTRTPPSPQRAAAIVACHPPQTGYGFEQGACGAVEKLELVRADVWRIQIRRPPVYCVNVSLEKFGGDENLDVDSVGELAETRCPPDAYPDTSTPDRLAVLRTPDRRRAGLVSLHAIGTNRTRVLVEAEADWAWIHRGSCRGPRPLARFMLETFHSYRSETTLRVSLEALLATPHALAIDGGGGHGGDPLACADLTR